MRPTLRGLWRRPDFLKLWAGQTVSLLGSAVTLLALPAVAIYTLGATPLQMGLLAATGSLPALLFGLVVGAWVDRRRRRPLLVIADLGRGLLLLAIPAAALLGVLRMGHLYAVAFLAGILSLIFEVAAQSLLPALVGREQLVEGNSKLETSRAAA
jgi:MFS family permease